MENIFEELKKLHVEFNRLYNLGLVGINDDRIQVSLEIFKKIYGMDFAGIKISDGGTSPYLELQYQKDNILFITLL